MENYDEQMWPEELQLDGAWMETDPRVMWLMERLRSDLKHKKVLLIARSGPVVEALENALRIHAGIRTAMFHEGMSLLERDKQRLILLKILMVHRFYCVLKLVQKGVISSLLLTLCCLICLQIQMYLNSVLVV